MDLDLALGSLGATLSGIAPRLYSGGVRVSLGVAALSPVSGSPTRYVLAGLPDGVSGDYRLSYEFPAGVFGSERWQTPASPPAIILPFRISGLAAPDMDLVLLRNGAAASDTLTVAELGSGGEAGDYLVSGWPAPLPGERWGLSWSLGGVFGLESWSRSLAPLAPADWRVADKSWVRNLLAGWTPAGVPPASPVAGPVPGAAGGWCGIVPERTYLDPNPVPSGRRAAPTVFAAWKLVYSKIAGIYEAASAPPRSGQLVCSIYSEDGSQDAAIDAVAAGLVVLLDTASDDPARVLCFDGETAKLETQGSRPPWAVVNIAVPFVD